MEGGAGREKLGGGGGGGGGERKVWLGEKVKIGLGWAE